MEKYTLEQLRQTREILYDFYCISKKERTSWRPPETVKTIMQLYNLRDRMIADKLAS